MTTQGPGADAGTGGRPRADRGEGARRGQRARRRDRLEAAFAAGDLERTESMSLFLADLMQALEQDDGQKLGGKSAEASRFILRAIDRELDRA